MSDDCRCSNYVTREQLENRLDRLMSNWFDRFRPVTFEEFDRRLSRVDDTLENIDGHVLAIEENITQIGLQMAANFDELNADLQVLVAGYQSVVAENAILRAQLATADADKQQAVADAIAADDVVDQAAVDAADAVVEAALAPPVEPPVA